MMLDPKALALPWTTETDLPYGEPRIYDATGALVAVVGNAEIEKQEDWERNAAAIVRAVNALSTVTPAEVGGLVERLRPLDLSNLLQHAFRSGFEIAGGSADAFSQWWPEYDPEECAAYPRVVAALSPVEAVPVAFMDAEGNVSVADGSPLPAMLRSLPDAPIGKPLLALYAHPPAQAGAVTEAMRPTGRVSIAHDGFAGDIIGYYTTREGKRGVVVQQDGTRVVHVYGEKWLTPPVNQSEEAGE